jgi:hypothetical protein
MLKSISGKFNCYDIKYVKQIEGALYYAIHRYENPCESHKFPSIILKMSESSCTSHVHKLISYYNNNKIFITFYDKNGDEMDAYIEFDHDEKLIYTKNGLHIIAKTYLDPKIKYEVFEIKMELFSLPSQYVLNLYVKVGNITHAIMGEFLNKKYKKKDLLKEVESMMTNDNYSKYDFSKITPNKISIRKNTCIIS